jgi:hypothetical protein
MKLNHCVGIAILTVFTACGGTPGPGDSGYAFNVDGAYNGTVSVEGQAFSGSLELTTAPGGVVSGTFRVTQPVEMGGDVEGTLMNDQLTVRMSYGSNPLTGCNSGSMTGTLTVTEGGARVAGPVTIDDCGQILGGSVRYTR